MPEDREKIEVMVNFKFHNNVVKVLDKLVKSGLYKSRVSVVLSALRSYEPFKKVWGEEIRSEHAK
jgi:Arc/MetJ-type ribon-helix-helix transcriptional regulator